MDGMGGGGIGFLIGLGTIPHVPIGYERVLQIQAGRGTTAAGCNIPTPVLVRP